MNKENPYRDQAERLRKRIEKVQETKNQAASLPPRSELHRHQRKRTKWKLKYPVIRLLVLFFILLPIVSFSVYSYFSGSKNGKAVKATVDSKGYETIKFEKAKPEKKPKSQKEKTAKPDSQQQPDNAGKNETKPNENPAPASPNPTS
ncbi:hypothetical protein ACQYAD_09720 [Neobacillus sp. SM06]|uniref:hypothetical protein n=1 Tax=Neobacillus sp. SM06 TaxID=3422492 RepID=UPI003D2AD544